MCRNDICVLASTSGIEARIYLSIVRQDFRRIVYSIYLTVQKEREYTLCMLIARSKRRAGFSKAFTSQHCHICLILDDISHLLEIAILYSPNELAHSRRRCRPCGSTRRTVVSTLRTSTFFSPFLSVPCPGHSSMKFNEAPAVTDGNAISLLRTDVRASNPWKQKLLRVSCAINF